MTSTGRLYANAQAVFALWCKSEGIAMPQTTEDIARYLQVCLAAHGPSSVPVHLSAIGDLVRSVGGHLDTKAAVIQAVTVAARKAVRGRNGRDARNA
jgi:hypothetical protein